jgi:hypothetical protein
MYLQQLGMYSKFCPYLSYLYSDPQLNLAIVMDGTQWEVTYVSWEDYTKAVLEAKDEMWISFEKADLIIGGMNFAIDFM